LLEAAAAAAGGIPSGGTADDDTAVESVVALLPPSPSFLVGTPNVNDMLCNMLLYRPANSISFFLRKLGRALLTQPCSSMTRDRSKRELEVAA
jgi:hypothetical protein